MSGREWLFVFNEPRENLFGHRALLLCLKSGTREIKSKRFVAYDTARTDMNECISLFGLSSELNGHSTLIFEVYLISRNFRSVGLLNNSKFTLNRVFIPLNTGQDKSIDNLPGGSLCFPNGFFQLLNLSEHYTKNRSCFLNLGVP